MPPYHINFHPNPFNIFSEEKMFEELLTTKDDDDGRQVMAIAHMAYGQMS